MNRRKFIQRTSYTAALGYLNTLPLAGMLSDEVFKLTILHTNDVHSRLDPFPMDGTRNEGQGGAAKRAALINQIRSEGQDILLLDCGDIFQGTPYFNMFAGEIEMKVMSDMGYDAGTIGNHDFDAGVEGLVKQLPYADFPFIISNYIVDDTPLSGKTLPYKIWNYNGIKIGIYGLGIELDGLVAPEMYGNCVYQDPIAQAKKSEALLSQEMGCHYVICLSHLGYRYRNDKVSDVVLAGQTKHTDLILGGHTHSFLKEPQIEKNLEGEPVVINQAGWAGILLGRIDLYFEKGSLRQAQKGTNIVVK